MMTRRGCAHRLAGWHLLAGVVLGCWLAGSAVPALAGDGIVDIPQLKDSVKNRIPFGGRLFGNKNQPQPTPPVQPQPQPDPVAALAPATPATQPDPVATTSPDSTTASTPDGPDYGAATPKALLERMAKVITLNDKPGAWYGFQPPANRDLVKVQLDCAAQLVARGKPVAELVQARIGNMEAGMIRGSVSGGVQQGGEIVLRNTISQMAPNGTVDWSQVKITEAGDKAQAVISNYGGTIPMAKANGKWYLGGDRDALAKEVEGTRKMTATSLKTLDQVEQKVKSGQMTKKNFIQEYSNIVNENFQAGAM